MSLEQNNNKSVNPTLQEIKNRNESYISTIHALHGFILAVRYHSKNNKNEVLSSIGRRMNFASGNSKRDYCTPDIVIQLNESEGMIGEAKLLICKNENDHWNKYINQIKKYDTDLLGWWTEDGSINNVRLILLTELSFSSQISDFFQSKIISGEISLNHPFSIVECSQHQKGRDYYFLRTRMGNMPSELDKPFREGIDIPLETLIVDTKERKFYDSQPQDIEYIMEILWQNIFTKEAISQQGESPSYNEKDKTWRIPVDLDELTRKVQRLYGSTGSENREVEYPKKSWIKEALEKFVSIKFAEKCSRENEYIIIFKKIRFPLERFVYLLNRKKRKSKSEGIQMDLFPNISNN